MKSGTHKNKSPVILYLIFILCVFWSTIDYCFRPIWYDEALTIREFASLPSYFDIYKYYVIPNNHICYTLILRIWMDLLSSSYGFNVFSLRLLSVLIACATVVSMYMLWKNRITEIPCFIVTISFIFSIPFHLYATAVRGYMLSCWAAVLIIYFTHKYISYGNPKFLYIYMLISFFSVGIMPSMLIFHIAVLIHEFPSLNLFIPRIKRWCITLFSSFLTFILFYLPIFPLLLKNASLKEGWKNSGDAVLHFYMVFGFSCIFVLIIGSLGLLLKSVRGYLKFRSRSNLPDRDKVYIPIVEKLKLPVNAAKYILPFFIPLFVFVLKHPAPFPRVFFVFWILFLYILAKGIKTAYASLLITHKTLTKKNLSLYIKFLSFFLIIAFYGLSFNYTHILKKYFAPKQYQDDFLLPYFMKKNFSPDRLVRFIRFVLLKRDNLPKKFYKEIRTQKIFSNFLYITPISPDKLRIFISPNSDPPSILFYARLFGLSDNIFIFDRPRKKVKNTDLLLLLSEGYNLYVIARDKQDLRSIKSRFSVTHTNPLFLPFFRQQLYTVPRK